MNFGSRIDAGRRIDILVAGRRIDIRVGNQVFVPVYIRVYHHVASRVYWRAFEEING
jgi:hypothetical protein